MGMGRREAGTLQAQQVRLSYVMQWGGVGQATAAAQVGSKCAWYRQITYKSEHTISAGVDRTLRLSMAQERTCGPSVYCSLWWFAVLGRAPVLLLVEI
jgi:hypothetical protein